MITLLVARQTRCIDAPGRHYHERRTLKARTPLRPALQDDQVIILLVANTIVALHLREATDATVSQRAGERESPMVAAAIVISV